MTKITDPPRAILLFHGMSWSWQNTETSLVYGEFLTKQAAMDHAEEAGCPIGGSDHSRES